MIETFSVQNFYSIKHEQTMSFVANNKIHVGTDKYLLNKVSDSVSLLKFCVLYGYNASGKTNLLRALDYLRSLVVKGKEGANTGTYFVPFVFDEDFTHAPGTFTLVFYINKIRYTYRVVVNTERILFEELSFQPKGRKALLFARTFDEAERISTFEFGTRCDLTAKERTILYGNTVDTITTLFAYQKSNIHCDAIEVVVEYFTNTLMPIITPAISLNRWTKERVAEDPSTLLFYRDLVQRADFRIQDVELLLNTGYMNWGEIEGPKDPKISDIVFYHKTSNGVHRIQFDEESRGTLRYVGLGGVVHELIRNKGIVPIDELEASLHPDLVAFLLQLFLMNATESQIIATAQSQSIMELDFMRSDMIWLCEKDEEGASQYYSVQEFGLHKKINIANAYRAGKLGAKPYLGSTEFVRETQ